MTQGPRGGWLRAAFTGLGAVLCAGAIGCSGLDKDNNKPGTTTKQPGIGLPGTPTLPGQPNPGFGTAKTGQPGYNNAYPGPATTGMGMGGIQQTGGYGSMQPTGRSATGQPMYSTTGSGTGTGYGTQYNSVVPNVGPNSSSGYNTQPIGYGAATTGGGYPMSPGGDTGYGRGNPPPVDFGTAGLNPPSAPGTGGAPVSPPGMPMAPLSPPPYRN